MKAGTSKRRFSFRFRWEYLILIALMGLFTIKFLDKTRQIQALNRQQAALLADNNQLTAANARLQKDIRYYATDQYAQDAARGLLGYTKPGETSIEVQRVIPRSAPVHVLAPRQAAPSTPVWQQWWDSFSR